MGSVGFSVDLHQYQDNGETTKVPLAGAVQDDVSEKVVQIKLSNLPKDGELYLTFDNSHRKVTAKPIELTLKPNLEYTLQNGNSNAIAWI